MLKLKRIYEGVGDEDGYRILVDRLWPRGVSKEEAKLDYWAKEIAPSDKLRKEFHHEDDKFKEFRKEYLEELNINKKSAEFIELIKEKIILGNVTFLYAAKNEDYNNAVVLKEWLGEKVLI